LVIGYTVISPISDTLCVVVVLLLNAIQSYWLTLFVLLLKFIRPICNQFTKVYCNVFLKHPLTTRTHDISCRARTRQWTCLDDVCNYCSRW